MIIYKKIPASTHSRLSASSAPRWLPCPGSIRLIALQLFGAGDDVLQDYTATGIVAHDIAADCLRGKHTEAWEFAGRHYKVEGFDGTVLVDDEMVTAVQTYVEHARALISNSAEHGVEHRVAVVGDCGGTADLWAVGNGVLDIVDYKHGVGVVVEASENAQMRIYALQVLATLENSARMGWLVRMTIVQPRAFHEGGAIRHEILTIAELLQWRDEILLPGIAAVDGPQPEVRRGSWCRFCPARSACPAWQSFAQEVLVTAKTVKDAKTLGDADLGALATAISDLNTLKKALDDEIYTRLLRGANVPGWKCVQKKSDRVWKGDEVRRKATTLFGSAALTEPELKSPAQVDKLPGGKKFTAEWAFKPDTGTTLARADDARAAVRRAADVVFAAVK